MTKYPATASSAKKLRKRTLKAIKKVLPAMKKRANALADDLKRSLAVRNWQRNSKKKRCSMAVLAKKLGTSTRSIQLMIQKGLSKRLERERGRLEVEAKIRNPTFSSAAQVSRSFKAPRMGPRRVRALRKPVNDASRKAVARRKTAACLTSQGDLSTCESDGRAYSNYNLFSR